MLVGAVAISGIPPLAGFFSKDEILGESFKNGFLWVWAIGFVVAALTAFYMFRLIGMTFWGESRVDPHVEPNIHESPRTMTVPLILLAIPSAVLGLLLGFPPESGIIHGWLEPVFAPALWWFHREVVDGTVNASGSITSLSGRRLSRVQTGRVQNYALGIAVGLIVMAGSYLLIAGRR